MIVLLDGLTVLQGYGVGIAGFFVSVLGLGLLTTRCMVGDGIDKNLKLLIGLSIGSVTLSVLSYVLVIAGHWAPSILESGSILILVLSLAVLAVEYWPKPRGSGFGIRLITIIILALFLLLIIRLVFLKHILVPPYSDSVIHFQIVQDFLHPGKGSDLNISLENLPQRYYHLGFHGLAAWLTSVSGIDPLGSIPLLGQLFLVIAPVSIALLAYVTTKDRTAALFAGLLGALGWTMPAFAANWGKYPAISSLVSMPGVLASFSLYQHEHAKKQRMLFSGLFLLTGITLMHTRITVVVLLAAISFWVSKKAVMKDELSFAQAVRFSLLYVISLSPLYSLLGEFYVEFPVAIVILLLLPFAFQAYPRLSLGIAFFTFCLWLIQLIPTLVPEYSPTLLNDQFIEIMLYIPFSLLGGAGFGGLIKTLPTTGYLRWIAGGLPIVFVAWNFWAGQSIYPDPCCQYYGEGDRAAFQWIKNHTTDRSLILVSAFENGGQIFGTDAGIWIDPLTGRDTNKLVFDIDWNLEGGELDELCQAGAREIYIYMGGREFSFESSQLKHAAWAEPVFGADGTVIYRITGCLE